MTIEVSAGVQTTDDFLVVVAAAAVLLGAGVGLAAVAVAVGEGPSSVDAAAAGSNSNPPCKGLASKPSADFLRPVRWWWSSTAARAKCSIMLASISKFPGRMDRSCCRAGGTATGVPLGSVLSAVAVFESVVVVVVVSSTVSLVVGG